MRNASSAMPMCEKAQWSATAVQGIDDAPMLQSVAKRSPISLYSLPLCLCLEWSKATLGSTVHQTSLRPVMHLKSPCS